MQTVSQTLAGHRSIRAFTPATIPQAVIDEVLHEAITGTSSSGNLNSYAVVLTRDPQRRQRLYELHGEQDFILQAPLLMTFCADWYRVREWLRLRGARDNFGHLLGYHVAAFDAMLLSQSVSLAFEARGYGLCYLGTTLNAMPDISAFLELLDTCVPVTTMAVGVPAEDPSKRDRLPLAAYVHDERYQAPPKMNWPSCTGTARKVAGPGTWRPRRSRPSVTRAQSRRWRSFIPAPTSTIRMSSGRSRTDCWNS
ncbi:nitroreductase family protein [Deinococcus radiophilus]|uniref:nitroreductase family protein n=1 Tax=Deinococcus radiophilus TaxID=32062 RepID=UPI00361954B5